MEDCPTLSQPANQPVTSKTKSQRTQIREQKAFSRDYSGENEGQKAHTHLGDREKCSIFTSHTMHKKQLVTKFFK